MQNRKPQTFLIRSHNVTVTEPEWLSPRIFLAAKLQELIELEDNYYPIQEIADKIVADSVKKGKFNYYEVRSTLLDMTQRRNNLRFRLKKENKSIFNFYSKEENLAGALHDEYIKQMCSDENRKKLIAAAYLIYEVYKENEAILISPTYDPTVTQTLLRITHLDLYSCLNDSNVDAEIKGWDRKDREKFQKDFESVKANIECSNEEKRMASLVKSFENLPEEDKKALDHLLAQSNAINQYKTESDEAKLNTLKTLNNNIVLLQKSRTEVVNSNYKKLADGGYQLYVNSKDTIGRSLQENLIEADKNVNKVRESVGDRRVIYIYYKNEEIAKAYILICLANNLRYKNSTPFKLDDLKNSPDLNIVYKMMSDGILSNNPAEPLPKKAPRNVTTQSIPTQNTEKKEDKNSGENNIAMANNAQTTFEEKPFVYTTSSSNKITIFKSNLADPKTLSKEALLGILKNIENDFVEKDDACKVIETKIKNVSRTGDSSEKLYDEQDRLSGDLKEIKNKHDQYRNAYNEKFGVEPYRHLTEIFPDRFHKTEASCVGKCVVM